MSFSISLFFFYLLVLKDLRVALHAIQEVYEQQKELILLGERVVLATLGFDLNVHHPYKPLVEAIKKFKVAQNALAQVAWNFVNDGYDRQASVVFQFLEKIFLQYSSLSPFDLLHAL